jgi:hypothetical protein
MARFRDRRADLSNFQNYTETKNLTLIESDAALLTIVAGNLAMARANKWVVSNSQFSGWG